MQYFSTLMALALGASTLLTAHASVGVHCGTTGDAVLSDCKDMLNDKAFWDGEFNTGATCTYTNPFSTVPLPTTAYNVACKGECCVYVAATGADTVLKETTRQEALGLLGCGDEGANKINGMQKFDDGHGVCIGDRGACGDCFDDIDFA
ncbi:hypothetical protein FA10DRAFT_303678 [Acaromyces ingoldii]|uniref:Uncharacterized protein n=1 Tax=Acaromyces ingoldii TaxID=215250 RepID=A0A316YHS0_9BASI|nr:hypothetical protein FA10DRAFT_303678 [Acaromyces ingoldii]PWN88749.1 hypothetical protein FA10DRAFT_303678 [Acaromyces ingoldii]